jgi:LacI family transcriptional regulator
MAKHERSVAALQDVAQSRCWRSDSLARDQRWTERKPGNPGGGQRRHPRTGSSPESRSAQLEGAKTKTIGLVVPSVADPFFSSAAAAIQDVARLHGSLVVLATSNNDPVYEREQMVTLIQRRIDGLILVPSGETDRSLFEQAGFPTICLDRPIKGKPIATVLGDNYGGAKAATKQLVEHGYKRILCLGGDPELFTSRRRFHGHREVIRKAGLPYLAEFNVQDYASAEAAVLAYVVRRSPADAILTTKNSTTVYVYKTLRKLGLKIPGDVALLGYDDFDLADALDPPISVVRQPVTQLATAAAELLFNQMEMGVGSQGLVTMDVELVRRQCCGCSGRVGVIWGGA